MKKIILGITALSLLLILAGCGLQNVSQQQTAKEPIKIGAILPLTGPVAIWGENIKNGMEMAKSELEQAGDEVSFAYDDSQGTGAQAVTQFQKMIDVNKSDVVFSIFSRVSVPLIPLAKSNQVPLIMSIVSASNVASADNYTFRFYSDAKQYVDPHFAWITKDKYGSVAILAINDEFGADVNKVLKDRLAGKGIKIVAEEKYLPNATDFRTQLTKIKRANPKAIIFIGSVPAEITNALKQANELKIGADFIEASASLANVVINPSLMSALQQGDKNLAEGVYTIAFPFTLGKTGDDFKVRYKEVYGKDPNYAAAFGYDMVMLVAKADKAAGSGSLKDKIVALENYDSLNGPVKIQANGEINPPTYSVKIVDGKMVEIK